MIKLIATKFKINYSPIAGKVNINRLTLNNPNIISAITIENQLKRINTKPLSPLLLWVTLSIPNHSPLTIFSSNITTLRPSQRKLIAIHIFKNYQKIIKNYKIKLPLKEFTIHIKKLNHDSHHHQFRYWNSNSLW